MLLWEQKNRNNRRPKLKNGKIKDGLNLNVVSGSKINSRVVQYTAIRLKCSTFSVLRLLKTPYDVCLYENVMMFVRSSTRRPIYLPDGIDEAGLSDTGVANHGHIERNIFPLFLFSFKKSPASFHACAPELSLASVDVAL